VEFRRINRQRVTIQQHQIGALASFDTAFFLVFTDLPRGVNRHLL
jgi:hypothetical protein